MPRCDWCHQFTRTVQTVPNGRSNLHLCPMCSAEHELHQQAELRVADLIHTPGWWDRVKKFLRL